MAWPYALPPPCWFYSPNLTSPLSLATEWYEKLMELFKPTDDDLGSDGEGPPLNYYHIITSANIQRKFERLEKKFLSEGVCNNEEGLAKLSNYEIVMIMFYASFAAFSDSKRDNSLGYEALMAVLYNAGDSD